MFPPAEAEALFHGVPAPGSPLHDALAEQLEMLGRALRARPSVGRSAEVQRVLARGSSELRRALEGWPDDDTRPRRAQKEACSPDYDCLPTPMAVSEASGCSDVSAEPVAAPVAAVRVAGGGPARADGHDYDDDHVAGRDIEPSLTAATQVGTPYTPCSLSPWQKSSRPRINFSNKNDGLQQMRRSKAGKHFRARSQTRSRLFRLVDDPKFDVVFGFFIVVNTVAMVVEEQFKGAVVGYRIKFYPEYGSPGSIYSNTEIFYVLEWIFALVFLFEVCLRIGGFGRRYWKRPSEYFDLTIVIVSLFSLLSGLFLTVNFQLGRLLRVAKLLRLIRLLRTIEEFDALHLMTTALKYSMSALCWSIIMLMGMQTFVALLLNTVFRALYLNEDSWLAEDAQLTLYEYFGSYTRTMCSLFEISLANWPPICRFLMENLWEGWMIFVIMYKLTMGVAVVGVINAVFMQETMKVASMDDIVMVRIKARATAIHEEKMREFFEYADADHDCALDRVEFERVLTDKSIQTWLSSMDVDASNPGLLFDLVSQGKETVTLDDLVKGMSSLKGPSRAFDMKRLLRKVDDAVRRDSPRNALSWPTSPNRSPRRTTSGDPAGSQY